MRVLF